MPIIFDVLYREYCRARLTEMRKQLLLWPGTPVVAERIARPATPTTLLVLAGNGTATRKEVILELREVKSKVGFAARWRNIPEDVCSEGTKQAMATEAADRPRHAWPIFRSLASFRPGDLPGDLIAGLTLAAIAIPEQMATARLGGFSPQIGFFAFIAESVGFAMFGGNRFLSCGADSTITPIFAGGLVLMAASGSPDYQALAVALALMVGVILVLGSLFRLGWIANLLSTPVTVGFLAGISVHILVSQLPGVLDWNRRGDRRSTRSRCWRSTLAKPIFIPLRSASACSP